MTAFYFANANRFVPLKKGTGLPALESITGVLEDYEMKDGNAPSGYWAILHLKKDEDYFNVYFDGISVGKEYHDRLNSLRGKIITVRSQNELLVLDGIDAETEPSIRAELLKGVAAGYVKAEDLPALMAFGRGNEDCFEKWSVFKQKAEIDGLEKTREDIARETEEVQAKIDRANAELVKLREISFIADKEKDDLVSELNATLTLLQGEIVLHGTTVMRASGLDSEQLVRIGDSNSELIKGFEKFNTRKGVFVISGDKLFKIHHAYLEKKGRAFLLGSSVELKTRNPEQVKELVDRIVNLRYEVDPDKE